MTTSSYQRFHELGARLVAPHAQAHDEAATFHRMAFRAVCDAGLFRLPRDASYSSALEGLAAGSGDLGFTVALVAHGVGVAVLEEHGSAAQQARYLEKLLSGAWLCAVANAEPGAGTDLMGLKSKVVVTDRGALLTARKRSITNIGEADLAFVSARVQGVPARDSVNVFLVETSGPRVAMRRRTDLAALRTSPTGDLLAHRAPLPDDARVGALGAGLALFRFMFSEERLFCGVLYLAAIRRSLERALAHTETRRQFGRPIGQNQYVQEKVVRMRIAEELLSAHLDATLLRWRAGHDVMGSMSIVKAYGVEAALDCASDLVRLLGAAGLKKAELAEKVLRDLLGLSILGGTVELQKIVIYNEAVKQRPHHLAAAAPRAVDDDLTVTVHDTAALPPSLVQKMVALVAKVFPGEPALVGRYYYDSEPSLVALCTRGEQLVGMRAVVTRTVPLGGRDVVVAGIGVAVDPAHQNQGIGTVLTARTLEALAARGYDLAVAFLFSRASEALLTSFGFRRLSAKVTFLQRDTGALVEEAMPCYAREVRDSALVDEIEARGELHLGVGTW